MLKTEYKILHGRTDLLESQINSMLAQGWILHGSTFPYSDALAQALIRTVQAHDIEILTESGDGC